MNEADFDSVVKSDATFPELQQDWTRQRETARAFLQRFSLGYDTQLLGDEVGMGKTYVAMAMMGARLHATRRKHGRALLITPSSAVLRSKWEQELREFSDRYLIQGRRKAAQLRPLAISNYWQLVANLHHYEGDAVRHVTKHLEGPILESFRSWCVRNSLLTAKRRFKVAVPVPYDPGSVDTLWFESRFSGAAWWAFLDEIKSGHTSEIEANVKLLTGNADVAKSGFHWLKGKFREFSAVQDRFTPNVLLLGMSGLRRPRYDSGETLQFCTFAVGVLLARRHAATRNALIAVLTRANVILQSATSDSLKALEAADLYRIKASILASMDESAQFCAEWDELLRTHDAGRAKHFLKRLADAVVSRKLRESGICLAVIDEAHNWKDGKNGADTFRDVFAAGIPNKLLMSATPFQLEEGEMRSVFRYAAMDGGRSMAVLDDLFKPGSKEGGSIASRCLAQNARFDEAWRALAGRADAMSLLHDRITGTSARETTDVVRALCDEPYLEPSLKTFCGAALSYREAIGEFVARQREVMIRHVKRRGYRAFHSGADFLKSEICPQRISLYQVEGMAEADDSFVHYLAMRMDQQLRARGKQANAHLMSGLTSSVSAYQASAKPRTAGPKHVDAITSRYVEMFGSVLASTKHPKVRATVTRTLENYRNGRKTLIFCERVDTLKEIQTEIFKVLDQHDAPLGKAVEHLLQRRKDFLEHAETVDMRLARLFWLATSKHPEVERELRTMQADAERYASEILTVTGVNVTARRVIRLMDIWALAHLRPVAGVLLPKSVQTQFRSVLHGVHNLGSRNSPLLQAVLAATPGRSKSIDEIRSEVSKHARAWFGDQPNIWEDVGDAAFASSVWQLLDSEAGILCGMQDAASTEDAFYDIVLALQRGLRKVLLRPDLFRSYVLHKRSRRAASLPPMSELPGLVWKGVRRARGLGESPWHRTSHFMQALLKANGSINPHATTNTKRRSLWRGANIQSASRGGSVNEAEILTSDDDLAVQVLSGATSADRRISICAAFNSPLAPDILVCTSIGSEGIDLHRECAEVIHHDLPWNPAKLEQRIGRVDRVGSLAEVNSRQVRIGLPFQQHTYERWQHDVLLGRAQRFQVLLGKPDFDPAAIEEEDFESENGCVIEPGNQSDTSDAGAIPALPVAMLDWLSVDLSLNLDRAGA